MKTTSLFLITISLCLLTKVQAQTRLGVKAGLNYVNNAVVSSPYAFDSERDYRLGYHAGILTQIALSNTFFLKPELLFSDKGFKGKGQANAQPAGDAKLHLYYLNLPLPLAYSLTDKLAIEAGPELGYLVAAKSKFETRTVNVTNFWDQKLDLGILSGVTYALSEKLMLGLRYTHGLLSAQKDITYTDINGLQSKQKVNHQNRTFQLSFAYWLK